MDSVIVGVLVLALVVRRQLQVRAVNDAGSALIPVALVAIGAAEVAAYADSHPPAAVTVATIAGSLVVAVVLGAARASTVRLWVQEGRVLRQGTAVTIVLWLVSLGLHLLSDRELAARGHAAAQLGQVSVLLYLGITLGVQGVLVRRRARGMVAA
jgi:hypothetical protein